jgi:acyl-CoA synthetase (AMP-forming)/AMP-acid ligase II
VRCSIEWNFAHRLVQRLGRNSDLTDAATGQVFSAADVPGRIAGFGAGFLSRGLHPRDRVLISCGLNPESVLAYLGAIYAGCVPVLVDERTLAACGDPVFAKAQAKAAWTANRVSWDGARRKGLLQMEGGFEPCPVSSVPPAPCLPDDLAVLMPTSGTAGVPRLVMVSHGNLIANTEAIIRSQSLGRDEKAMLILPVSYCFGASVVHTHLYQGGGIVFDSRFMFPDKTLRAINTYGCTTFAGVPSVYNILLRRSHLGSIPLPGLRRFLQAGGPLAPENIQALRQRMPAPELFVMYGQTEATARISCLPPDRLEGKLGSAGAPLDNLLIRVVDDQGQALPPGQTGNIQVSGPSVCAGYLDDPVATKGRFIDGWLNTGDVGSRDEQGYLWVCGRSEEFIKMRGIRVSFAEVEAVVAAVPGVFECAAAGIPHPEAGDALILFVVGEGGAHDLSTKIRHTLPPQWTCSSVRVVPQLPKTANGKIARSQLQALV